MAIRMMKRFSALAAALFFLVACGGPVSPEKVQARLDKAQPGDTVVLKDGVYADLELNWSVRAGQAPVVLRPETKGGAVFTGSSHVNLAGEGLEVQGLLFRDIVLGRNESVVTFRQGDSLARGCRLTDCAFDGCGALRRDTPNSYISLYGRRNRVDHCSLLGKKNLGVTLVVMLDYPGCLPNGHSIDHNWFGPRPVYGSNGAETMRVGTSHQCMENSRTVIADNLFERCDGEVEVVSIKSCENIIERNTFLECQGVLALRHGDRNVARENLFLGNGVRNTGGIRIVGEDQQVLDNRFLGLRGKRFFAPLALMYGVPNSLPNRYMQVKRTVVRGNLWADCSPLEFDTGSDFERTLPPVGTVWEDNEIRPRPEPAPAVETLREGRGASWYTPVKQEVVEEVITISDAELVLDKPIEVHGPMKIVAAPGVRPVIRFAGKKRAEMIRICEGGSLVLEGMDFDGEPIPGKAAARGAVCTDEKLIAPYTLRVSDCGFRNFGESTTIPIQGLKGTFADSVVVRGCRFEALSGDAISFAAESDDKGRYNADDMIIEGCVFERILGIPVNVYRGGTDESTAGPYVYVRGCSFVEANNKVRGAALRIVGAQILRIEDCSFTDSGKGGYCITLDDAPWEDIRLSRLQFVRSGGVKANRIFSL